MSGDYERWRGGDINCGMGAEVLTMDNVQCMPFNKRSICNQELYVTRSICNKQGKEYIWKGIIV